MPSIVIVATIWPKPEHRAEVLEAFRAPMVMVHEEPGCSLYALHEAPDRLVMIEQWEGQEAFDGHIAGDALKVLHPSLEGKLARETDLLFLDPVVVGDDAHGRLRVPPAEGEQRG